MKFAKILSLALLLLFPLFTIAQASIACPPDLSINVENLDETYSSYGDPIVTGGDDWVISKEITTVNNSCESEFALIATITYTASDPNGIGEAWCNQMISMVAATFDDIVFPEDITLTGIKASDADPSLTGSTNLDNNQSNIFFGYDDQTIVDTSSNSVKILRTWTALFWCTGQIETHVQIITIEDVLDETGNGAFVIDCTGGIVTIDDVIIKTNDGNVEIDQAGCSLTDGTLLEYVNCVVGNNEIGDGFNYEIDIIKNDGYLNGVSTLDIVMIQRHILGIELLSDPCKIVAADLSNNNSISAIDLLEARKLILGIYTVLPNSPSWKFLNVQEGPNGPKELIFAKEEFPLQQLGILPVKIGDVNDSAIGN